MGIKKGLLVGLANLVVCAFLIGLDEGVRHLPAVLMIVLVIGAGPALAVGGLCGWIAGRLPIFRRFVLIAIPMMAVISLGLLSDPSLIGAAVLPTMLGGLGLEYWTRPNLAALERSPGLTPTTLGVIIGAMNVAVVAIVLAIYVTRVEPRHLVGGVSLHPPFGLHFAALVMCMGAIPGMIVGALAGFLAAQLKQCNLLTRLAGIGSVAVSGVFALGALANSPILVIPALMPTLFAVCVLEKMTRAVDPFPAARVVT